MPDSSHNPARIAFIRRFKWDTVTTFSQNEEVHSLAVNDLVTQLERANISCTATITFGEANFKDQLKMLRVIMDHFSINVKYGSLSKNSIIFPSHCLMTRVPLKANLENFPIFFYFLI